MRNTATGESLKSPMPIPNISDSAQEIAAISKVRSNASSKVLPFGACHRIDQSIIPAQHLLTAWAKIVGRRSSRPGVHLHQNFSCFRQRHFKAAIAKITLIELLPIAGAAYL